MESYKKINRELTLRCQELLVKNNLLTKENIHLKYCLSDERAYYENKMKVLAKKIFESYNSIIQEFHPAMALNLNNEKSCEETSKNSNDSNNIQQSNVLSPINGRLLTIPTKRKQINQEEASSFNNSKENFLSPIRKDSENQDRSNIMLPTVVQQNLQDDFDEDSIIAAENDLIDENDIRSNEVILLDDQTVRSNGYVTIRDKSKKNREMNLNQSSELQLQDVSTKNKSYSLTQNESISNDDDDAFQNDDLSNGNLRTIREEDTIDLTEENQQQNCNDTSRDRTLSDSTLNNLIGAPCSTPKKYNTRNNNKNISNSFTKNVKVCVKRLKISPSDTTNHTYNTLSKNVSNYENDVSHSLFMNSTRDSKVSKSNRKKKTDNKNESTKSESAAVMNLENRPRRAITKNVNYVEPNLNRKMRKF